MSKILDQNYSSRSLIDSLEAARVRMKSKNSDTTDPAKPKNSTEFGRSMLIDAFQNQQTLKFEDIIKHNPEVNARNNKVKDIEDKYTNIVLKDVTLKSLQTTEIKSAIESSLKIRDYSTMLGIRAAELKSSNITTTDTDAPDTYISIEASTITTNQSLTVSVWSIASSYNISVGTKDSTEPTAVYNAIQAAVSVSAAGTAALSAVGSNISEDGFPANPQSRIMYTSCYVEAQKTVQNLVSLKSSVTDLWGGMNKTISDGFEKADTVIVGTGANLLPAGTYYLYSMPYGINAAKDLNTYITQANSIYQAINAISSSPNITREEGVSATAGISGLTYDGSGLPSNNDFAYAISNAAYTSALPLASGGTLAANVKTAAAAIATSSNAATYSESFGVNKYQSGSPILSNIAFTSLLQSIEDAANTSGSTLSSVQAATSAALSAYKTKCSIVLTNGNTLESVVDSINCTTQYSGVAASINMSGAGSYMLNIYGTNTGTNYPVDILNALDSDVKATLFTNVVKYEAPGTNAICQVGNSSFKQLITSNANRIEYGGAYINLLKANSSTSAYQTIIIGDDTGIYKDKIVNFVNSLNDLIIFIAKQMQVDPNDRDKYKDTTLLRNDPILSSLSLLVNNAVNYTTSYDSGYTNLPTIGIDLKPQIEAGDLQYNIFTINNNVSPNSKADTIKDGLDVALHTNYNGVRRVFELMNSISSPKLLLNGFNGQYKDLMLNLSIHIIGSFGPDSKQVKIETLDTLDNSVITTEYYNLSGSANAYSISCANKTSNLYGLNFLYMDSVNANNISVRIRQGVADYLWAGLNSIDSQISTRTLSINEEKFYIKQSLDSAKEDLKRRIQIVSKNASSNVANINKAAAIIHTFGQLTSNNNTK
ncbi:MAG: hypothetical protein EB127_04005 [Alphaproteobacteria bacterium]|nr:hypothetical protein [Alphaproteobacteria bacterium]